MAVDALPPIASLKIPTISKSSIDKALFSKAESLITDYNAAPDILKSPATTRALLLEIIKPLFSTTQHPSLAPSGRKAAFAPPPLLPHASSPLVFGDENQPPWKRNFSTLTAPLLRAIISSYAYISSDNQRAVLEDQIFLLTPALLNLLDDGTPNIKTTGFDLLHDLSKLLSEAKSPILHKSGLTEVFINALESDFMLLPTLTPEAESLNILGSLYPALLALIAAGFPDLPSAPSLRYPSDPVHARAEAARQKLLTSVVLNKGILPSLAHLSAGVATSHPPIVALLLEQLRITIERMGIYSTSHLQTILPLLRGIVAEPFSMAAPRMVCAAIDCLDALITTCPQRIREHWWPEILRALIGGWLAVPDEVECNSLGAATGTSAAGPAMNDIKKNVENVTQTLRNAMVQTSAGKASWSEACAALIEEEPLLAPLLLRP
ncbi:uncharacterized protein AB675_4627 [Cyphellophora attinorum]|uniref:Uncharacterized protein n=1 Tax=Cyphellophora attinorum TaxID=1664694 RepID=A0A0N1NZP5_9EURO|nr:uncharacterized protein AB675_4627 [Phialophora attinorum]KPI38954.1 hypothetical protein AB675_4627 [Phialophora attinorum]